MKNERRKTYSVYALKTSDGCVFVGRTALPCEKRWKNGNGFLTSAYLRSRILTEGWDSVGRKVVAEGLSIDDAEMVEKAAVCVTEHTMRNTPQTVVSFVAGAKAMAILNRSSFDDWLGESLCRDEWDYQMRIAGLGCSKGVAISETQTQKGNNMKQKAKKETKKVSPMRMQTAAGVKLELGLDTRRIKNDGQYPVTIRLYQGGKYRHLPTGYSASAMDFPNFTPAVEAHLHKQFDDAVEEVTKQALSSSVPDIMTVGVRSHTVATLAEAMEERRSLLDNESSRYNYTSAVNTVRKVFPDGLPCQRINSATVGRVLDHMKTEGYATATMNIYLSAVKSSINYGIYKGYIRAEQYPFRRNAYELDKITLPKSVKRDENHLTKTQMQTVWEYFKDTKNKWVGAFLFSYLHGGMNLADMLALKFDGFYTEEGGFKFKRMKTSGKCDFVTVVPKTDWTDELFSILGITPREGENVFKMFANGKSSFATRKADITTYINKTLAKMNGTLHLSEKKISMTFARHTFCTVANKTGMPYSMVEAAMSHSSGGVASHYIGRWTVEEMRPHFMRLL